MACALVLADGARAAAVQPGVDAGLMEPVEAWKRPLHLPSLEILEANAARLVLHWQGLHLLERARVSW